MKRLVQRVMRQNKKRITPSQYTEEAFGEKLHWVDEEIRANWVSEFPEIPYEDNER